jgi:hypothetical protein
VNSVLLFCQNYVFNPIPATDASRNCIFFLALMAGSCHALEKTRARRLGYRPSGTRRNRLSGAMTEDRLAASESPQFPVLLAAEAAQAAGRIDPARFKRVVTLAAQSQVAKAQKALDAAMVKAPAPARP